MSDEATELRNQAKRCRRLAESIPSERDQAMLRRVAQDFEQAADEIEKKNG